MGFRRVLSLLPSTVWTPTNDLQVILLCFGTTDGAKRWGGIKLVRTTRLKVTIKYYEAKFSNYKRARKEMKSHGN